MFIVSIFSWNQNNHALWKSFLVACACVDLYVCAAGCGSGGWVPSTKGIPKQSYWIFTFHVPLQSPTSTILLPSSWADRLKKKREKKNKKKRFHRRVHWDDKQIQKIIPHNWDGNFFTIPVFSGTGMNNPNLYLKACTYLQNARVKLMF